jgi:hypothetical protein
MKVVRRVVLCITLAASSPALASSMQAGNDSKDDLLTLYLLSIAADRCGFAMTAKQTDTIERMTQVLAERLKLKDRDTDAIYSEADVKFEQQGARACDRNGSFAKGFSETLHQLTGP